MCINNIQVFDVPFFNKQALKPTYFNEYNNKLEQVRTDARVGILLSLCRVTCSGEVCLALGAGTGARAAAAHLQCNSLARSHSLESGHRINAQANRFTTS